MQTMTREAEFSATTPSLLWRSSWVSARGNWVHRRDRRVCTRSMETPR